MIFKKIKGKKGETTKAIAKLINLNYIISEQSKKKMSSSNVPTSSSGSDEQHKPRQISSRGRGRSDRSFSTDENVSFSTEDERASMSAFCDLSIGDEEEKISMKQKPGEAGTKIQLLANYFKLEQLPTFQFRQYHISFDPETDIEGLRKFLVHHGVGGKIQQKISL